jgi:zinc protease
VITVNAPEKTGVLIPSREAVLALIDSVDNVTTTPYVDAVASVPLMAKAPPAASVSSTNEFADLGITEWRLSNGVRVVLKPTDFKNDEVVMAAFSPGGTSLAGDRDIVPAQTAASVVTDGGISSFDQIALQKLLAGKIAGVTAQIGELEEGLSGSASPQDLETLFQLIYLRFTAPRKDSIAFVSNQVKSRGMLENRSARPESAFEDTVSLTMAQYHPRRRPFTVATVDGMDLNRSYAFYRDRFADASDFTFVFVGAFSPEKIKPYVLSYLGGLPSLQRKESWRDVGVRRPTGVVTREVRAGIEPKSQVRMFYTGPFSWSIENRNALFSMTEVMRIKLREAIREEKGGTYGISVSSSMSKFPVQDYTVSIGFGCAPDRVEELVREVNRQIDSLKKFGPDPSYTQKVRELSRRERETSVKQNRWWLGRIYSYYWNQDDLREYFLFDRLMDSITPAAVKQSAVKYLDETNVATFVMYPRAK